MYPLRFSPIFKTALWGGDQLRPMLGAPPSSEPTGEAWLLSDVSGSETVVSEGSLAGKTLGELLKLFPDRLLGRSALANERFPLLLKFLDARQHLSIQVHPDDAKAKVLEPESPGSGKTEAWVILQAELESLLFAGLKPGLTRESFEKALRSGKLHETMHQFHPEPGHCIFLSAGTVHAIGAGLLLFEIQQTSDITYRLYDWERVDQKTGKPRALHVEKSLECSDFTSGPCHPQKPLILCEQPVRSEMLVDCPFFRLIRHRSAAPFSVGTPDECRAIVIIAGEGTIQSLGESRPLRVGDTFLLPAEIGECSCVPTGELTLLECCLPRRES